MTREEAKRNLMYANRWEDVDLCSDCEEKFAEWLEGDE